MEISPVSLAADTQQELPGWAASIRRTFVDHLPLYICAIAFCGIIFAILTAYDVPFIPDAGAILALLTAFALFSGFTIFGLLVGGIATVIDAARRGDPHPIRTVRTWSSDQFSLGDRPGNAFHAIVIFTPLLVACDGLKEVITRINPFSWDETFSQWDRVLGKGHLPWERLQPLIGHPAITSAFSVAYDMWFLLILGSLLWEGFSPRRDGVRIQYLIAFAFVWFIAGNLLAIAFSSAGPCYFGFLHSGANPYAPQMAYLRHTAEHWPIWSLTLQDALWKAYAGESGAISGISAMPSIHVTSSVLLALLAFRRNRVLGIVLWIYAAIIFIGSIHLAWHYAVDGIAGMLFAIVAWTAAGRIARADCATPLLRLRVKALETLKLVSASFVRTFPDHIPLYVCAVLFCAATLALTAFYRIQLEASTGLFFLSMVGQFLILGFAGLATFEFIQLIRAGFPDRPLGTLLKRIGERLLRQDRPGNILHSLIVLTPLMISFSAVKLQIPKIHPFAWDQTFTNWDRAIGMGRLPWEILQPFLGYPWITAGLNLAYDAWFLLMFGVLFSQAFAARSSTLRMQFLLAFSFAWFIAGNILAAIFSSAGPCFYGLLNLGPDPYAAQLTYLHAAAAHWPSWSLEMQDTTVQKILWTSYVANSDGLGGISAMPSMHLAASTLLALVTWRINRKLGIAFAIFLALIFLGSIHLAWHYAVDGIAGMVLAVLFWVVAGAIARASESYRMDKHTAVIDSLLDISRA
ncbi:MAG TPA: phosphatase PAP2 family protein [Rhizomicrobium sp.]